MAGAVPINPGTKAGYGRARLAESGLFPDAFPCALCRPRFQRLLLRPARAASVGWRPAGQVLAASRNGDMP